MLNNQLWPESQHKSLLKGFLNLFFAVWLTDAISLISKDEVEGSTVSKNEANQVTYRIGFQFFKCVFKQSGAYINT